MVELVKRVSSVAIVEPVTAEEPVAASEPAAAVAMTGDPETDARAWIEAVLGEPLGDETLHLVLKSGVVLCNLLNKISPGCCKKPTMKKLPFMQMENVSNYLTACNTTFKIQRELRVLHDGRPIRGQEHERGRAQHPCARTRHAVAKVHRDHARYRALDGPLTHQAATAGAPQRTADLTAFETVVFDADKSGTAAIDLVFRGAPTIQSMAHSELCVALLAIRELCEAFAVDGAHLLLPAPAAPDPVPASAGMLADTRREDGAHQDRAVRLVIRADIFVCCLPPDKRLGWYELWARGDPVARAYKEDMSLLAEGSACLSSAPFAAGTESGKASSESRTSASSLRSLACTFAPQEAAVTAPSVILYTKELR